MTVQEIRERYNIIRDKEEFKAEFIKLSKEFSEDDLWERLIVKGFIFMVDNDKLQKQIQDLHIDYLWRER